MHEMSLVQSILEIVEQEMAKHQVEKLRTIHLAVGRMSAVVPEQLTLCFEILTSNTPLAGTALAIQWVPLIYHCQDCFQDFPSEDFVSVCRFCGSDRLEIIQGRDLRIESIEVED